jgi:hypothetical protein
MIRPAHKWVIAALALGAFGALPAKAHAFFDLYLGTAHYYSPYYVGYYGLYSAAYTPYYVTTYAAVPAYSYYYPSVAVVPTVYAAPVYSPVLLW